MPDYFEFTIIDELWVTLGGVQLDLYGEFEVTCDGGNDGAVIDISWGGGRLDTRTSGDISQTLFMAMAKAIYDRHSDKIAEGLADGPTRRREAADERRAEIAAD